MDIVENKIPYNTPVLLELSYKDIVSGNDRSCPDLTYESGSGGCDPDNDTEIQ